MKPLFIISCPIDTYSGYGARSRDVVKAIINLDKYDVKVLPQRWGETAWGFIENHMEEWGFLNNHLLPFGNQLPKQPEIWAQITVPNEFQPVGKFNIGFTAGIETTIAALPWIDGMNRMDVNFVSSEHSKKVFEQSKYEEKNQQQQVVRTVELLKPIEVLFEGIDLDVYLPTTSEFDLNDIKESFSYLFVGHWMQGDFGEDRKNVGELIKSFLLTFKNKNHTPALILKCSGGRTSKLDKERILDKIDNIRKEIKGAKTLPNIYLIHGKMSDKEMNELYNHKKIKAMVSLTHGEGFGRPLLEFSRTKKPIIASGWSGQLDFLNPQTSTLLSGQLKNIHPSTVVKDMLIPESQWFKVNTAEFSHYLRDIFENYREYKEKAVKQAKISTTQFSFDKMEEKLRDYFKNYIPEAPEQVKLKLPKLKKIEIPKLKKVEHVKG